MSKWVQVRDSLLDAIKAEEVGKELKNRFVGWAEKEGIEFIQTAVKPLALAMGI